MLKKKSPLIFGEVLFDIFEGKRHVLGGAPFNVAWHLQGFGLDPYLISRIGNDKNGKKIIKEMNYWGMYLQNVQIDEIRPTGLVSVSVINNEPRFKILEEQAYDYIEFEPVKTHLLIKPYPLVYHGTLALRNKTSRQTLSEIKKNTKSKIFMDVNLRQPWWKKEIVLQNLNKANWIKCNHEELDTIVHISNIEAKNIEEQAHGVCKKFSCEFLIVTQGEKGAILVDKNQNSFHVVPPKILNITDTVGAGDAFSAVSILGILHKWDIQTLLNRAIKFSSKLCQVKGATLNDRQFYEDLLKEWKN